MIGKKLNLDGDSLVDIFIVRPTTEESHKFYKACYDKVIDVVWPKLTGYLEGQEVTKKVHACTTREELEALQINQVPTFLFKDIVDGLNAIKEMNDSERMFALAQMGDRLIFAATEWVEKVMQQRLQAIVMERSKGPKIIKPTTPHRSIIQP